MFDKFKVNLFKVFYIGGEINFLVIYYRIVKKLIFFNELAIFFFRNIQGSFF